MFYHYPVNIEHLVDSSISAYGNATFRKVFEIGKIWENLGEFSYMSNRLKRAIKLLEEVRFICNTDLRDFPKIGHRQNQKFIFSFEAAIARRGPNWEPSSIHLIHLERVFNLYVSNNSPSDTPVSGQEQSGGDQTEDTFRNWKFTSYLLKEIE